MSTRTVVHLLRHGEVHNPEKVLYGRIPGYRLSTLGEQMAVRAAEALADREFTAGEYAPGGGWEVLIAQKAGRQAAA